MSCGVELFSTLNRRTIGRWEGRYMPTAVAQTVGNESLN
jgi:hypothetical protein